MKISLKAILIVLLVLLVASSIFFIYTTSKSTPTKIGLFVPKNEKSSQIPPPEKAFIIILLKNDMAFVYDKNDLNNGKTVPLEEIRGLLNLKIKTITADSLFVVIKPSDDATYKNSVDVLDEMTINGIKHFSMSDPDEKEKIFLGLNKAEQRNKR